MSELLALCCVIGAANSNKADMARVWLFAAVGFAVVSVMS